MCSKEYASYVTLCILLKITVLTWLECFNNNNIKINMVVGRHYFILLAPIPCTAGYI